MIVTVEASTFQPSAVLPPLPAECFSPSPMCVPFTLRVSQASRRANHGAPVVAMPYPTPVHVAGRERHLIGRWKKTRHARLHGRKKRENKTVAAPHIDPCVSSPHTYAIRTPSARQLRSGGETWTARRSHSCAASSPMQLLPAPATQARSSSSHTRPRDRTQAAQRVLRNHSVRSVV